MARLKYIIKSFNDIYKLKKSGLWGYKWRWYINIEKQVLIIINFVKPPRIICRFVEIIFNTSFSWTLATKCICKKNKSIIHYIWHHL